MGTYSIFTDWYNRQAEANQQTNLQQMVYEQSQLIMSLIYEVRELRSELKGR